MSDELYIWVNRWEEFQVYHRKRNKTWAPPWIRVYTRLLDDHNYLGLTARQRGLLHDVWLLFAKTRLELGLSPARIGRMLGYETLRMRDFEALNQAGFLDFCSRTVLEQRRNAFWNGSALEVEVEVETPPTPPGGNGKIHLTAKDLRRYTGCKITRGTHGQGWKHDPLGTDKPPPDWPHEKPTRTEVEAALVAGVEDEFPF